MTKTSKEFLISKGWRNIGKIRSAILWDHKEHQPNRRGAFTTLAAIRHQKFFDKNHTCSCIKSEGYYD